jgi:hypothetical protein
MPKTQTYGEFAAMGENKRSPKDRRSGLERRDAYHLDYFLKGGTERRRFMERRWRAEMRKGWVRISRWSSKKIENDTESAATEVIPGALDES